MVGTILFKVKFFKESNGTDHLKEYLDELAKRSLTSKNDRVKLKKIIQYIELLKKYGTKLGEPHVKHISEINHAKRNKKEFLERDYFDEE